jgi:peptidyl-prolyl cis-trans isomerase C
VLVLCAAVCAAGCGKKNAGFLEHDEEPWPARSEKRLPREEKPAGRMPTDAVVEVDGVRLTQNELDRQIDRLLASRGQTNASPGELAVERLRVKRELLDRFVTRQVLLHEADRRGIVATESETTQAVGQIEAELPAGTSLQQAVAKSGMTEVQFRRDLEDELRIRKLVDNRLSALSNPSADEVEAFYQRSLAYFHRPESARARHILIRCDSNATEAVTAERARRAETIRQQLLRGADFAAVARTNSDCRSRDDGGNLGMLVRGQTLKDFEAAAFSQKTNEIGPVIRTPLGFHIIQVTEFHSARTQSLDEARGTIEAFLGTKGREETVRTLVEQLKSQATIRYRP